MISACTGCSHMKLTTIVDYRSLVLYERCTLEKKSEKAGVVINRLLYASRLICEVLL